MKVVHQEEYIHYDCRSTAPVTIESRDSPVAIKHPKTALSMEPDSQQEKQQDEPRCYCQTDESEEMICCGSKSCNIQWYHTICLHIAKISKERRWDLHFHVY